MDFLQDKIKKKQFLCNYSVFLLNGMLALSIGSLLPFIRDARGLDYAFCGLIVSLHSVGNLFSSFTAGLLPVAIGRKKSILFFNLFFALSYVLIIFGNHNWCIAMAFFLTGVARGATSNFCNTAINSLAPGKAWTINGLHAMFSVGAFLFPILLTLFTATGESGWITACYFMLAMGILSWILYAMIPMENDRVEKEKKGVRLDHISKIYKDPKTGKDFYAVKDTCLEIQPGSFVTLLGPSGCGKTTMINLLMRFYDVNSGAILVDGTDIRDATRHSLRKSFGMVLQDTWLFEGSIRDNLCYGKEGITDEQLDQVTRATGLYHLIHTLPEGYDTLLSDKLNLSAGQKQLMTIARAMIENAPMLILDEATSSVDTRTEMLIQQAMDTLTKGRTSFVIAHRLSTIKNADKILVMRHGDIIESGTHEELLQKGGFYAELYNSQFEQA